MSHYIMSIDQGTTGTTAAILNHGGHVVAKVNREYEQIFPKPGWVEHNPEHIWQSVISTVQEVLQKSGINPMEIAGIGITNQRETTLVWDPQTGVPVYNAIVWQCRRSADICNSIDSCTALEGTMSRSSTRVTFTPQGSVVVSSSRSRISLI